MAAHWFLTRKCIEKIGGFSPTFRHYGEDNNYAHRVVYHGLKIGVVPSLKVVHDRADRIYSSNKQMYLNYTSMLVRLSSPLITNKIKNIIGFFITSALNALRIKSFLPIKYGFKVIFSIKKIIKNKHTSMNSEQVFLN
ncbi:MAG: hypothetical protein IJ150_10930, partial [Bacteroidales bacterium]|nr:hypothetical protein [Bacteroidales bacterium]